MIVEFELDSDELDERSPQDLEEHIPHSEHDQRMPLLVGLFDSSASQRSLDISIQMRTGNGTSVIVGEDTINLDELAAKRTAGGGLVDSIANMANSILGAGAFLRFFEKAFRNSAILQVLLVWPSLGSFYFFSTHPTLEKVYHMPSVKLVSSRVSYYL
jgi:hypothetical protein